MISLQLTIDQGRKKSDRVRLCPGTKISAKLKKERPNASKRDGENLQEGCGNFGHSVGWNESRGGNEGKKERCLD